MWTLWRETNHHTLDDVENLVVQLKTYFWEAWVRLQSCRTCTWLISTRRFAFNAQIRHLFFFLFDSRRFWPKSAEIGRNPSKLAEKLAETAPIQSDSVRIRRGRRKIYYQKICEEKKKREGEEERSATKWFVRKKKKKNNTTITWRQMTVDFQIEPWNVILLKQCMWAVVDLAMELLGSFLVYKYPSTFVYL